MPRVVVHPEPPRCRPTGPAPRPPPTGRLARQPEAAAPTDLRLVLLSTREVCRLARVDHERLREVFAASAFLKVGFQDRGPKGHRYLASSLADSFRLEASLWSSGSAA